MIWRTSKHTGRQERLEGDTLVRRGLAGWNGWNRRSQAVQAGCSKRWRSAGFSLVELLVVLVIVAALSALIGIGVVQAINSSLQRDCLNNMIEIEAAKDEYARDHPGAVTIPSPGDLEPYFRAHQVPTCPAAPHPAYGNVTDLTQTVTCLNPLHTANNSFLTATPAPSP